MDRTITLTSEQFMKIIHTVGLFKNTLLEKAGDGDKLCDLEKKWLVDSIISYEALWSAPVTHPKD